MRTAFTVAGVLCLAIGPVRADDQAECRKVIDRAIKAVGGEEKLAKQRAGRWKSKGTFHGMGAAIPYTGEWAIQYPDKFRITLDLDVGGQKVQFIQVLNGGKGWQKVADMETKEMSKEELAEAKNDMHAGAVASLVVLKDKAYSLAPLGEVKVADRPAVGVRVSRKGHRDVSLYFDKEDGLLLKCEHLAKEQGSDKEVTQEEFYTGYKDVEGVKMATKHTIKRDGKLFIEDEPTDYEWTDKEDEGGFAKP